MLNVLCTADIDARESRQSFSSSRLESSFVDPKQARSSVSELCQNPICFGGWAYLSSEKQMPQVIVNKQK